jgi:beta-glucanase (GH16 family)
MLKVIPVYRLPVMLLGILLFSCGKKDEGGTTVPVVVPAIKVDDASQTRSSGPGVIHFSVTLDKVTTVPVSVDYTLVDGTAVSGRDYTTASGTITIPANQYTAPIDVQIKGDANDTRQNNLIFTVQLSNPKAGILGVQSGKGTIITENGTNLTTDNSGYTTPTTYSGYTLAWSDEFSGTAPETASWNFESGNNNGWGNNEKEFYTSDKKNVFLSNGNLIIEARKESTGGFDYSSARMTTQNKKSFTFGRIDIRAKLPVGKGIWPALWMLGSNITTTPWPACGEMDIMELIGTYPGRTYSTMHWKSASGGHDSKGTEFNLTAQNFSDKFHVFTIIWSQDLIKCLVDDQLFLTVSKADFGSANYPFNAPQFFIFNVAVGGDWPGLPDINTTFPQRMFVDYVRVFQ